MSQLTLLPRTESVLVVLILALSSVLSVPAPVMAADPAEYKSPGNMYSMEAHFRWCGEAKSSADRLKRYEKFWEIQAPETSDGYDDTLHVRTVRRCAYRLAHLYTELGRKKDCQKILLWLEKEDDTLKVGQDSPASNGQS